MITRAALAAPAFRCDAADGAKLRTVTRLDRGFEIAPSTTTPEGYLLCEARMAKPGILTYLNEDGSQRRELIREADLFNADSLLTMGRKPVTIEHPGEPVGPENVGELGVGDVDGELLVDNGYVKVRLCIRRADGLAAIRRGKQEVSPGYAIDLDETPGVDPKFGAYDAIQLRRRYNHLAITDAARGGMDIRLRADGCAIPRTDSSPDSRPSMNPKLIALLLKLGVKNIRKDAEEAMLDEAGTKADEMGTKLDEFATQATDLGAAKAKVAELETALAAAKAALSAAAPANPGDAIDAVMEADPVACDAAPEAGKPLTDVQKADSIRKAVSRQIAERVRLDTLAAGLGLQAKDVEKLGNRALRKAIVAKANPSARADAADDYYRAAIDMLPSTGATRTDAAADPADPYAGVSASFRRNVETGGERSDAADTRDDDADNAWKNTVGRAFNARHGIDNGRAAK